LLIRLTNIAILNSKPGPKVKCEHLDLNTEDSN